MFSVDNFYHFFQAHYGEDTTNANIWRFFPDGAKTIDCARSFKSPEQGIINHRPCVVLYDQEPFDFYFAVNTYKQRLVSERKNPVWAELSLEDLFRIHWHSTSYPIICHSEANSDDIKHIESLGFISCHYFWHAMISRYWFSHWKKHPGLSPQFRRVNATQRFLLYARSTEGTRAYRSRVLDLLRPIQHRVKHDWDGKNNISSQASATIDILDAQTTSIHLVAETLFDCNKIHLTEKTFKPMVMRQPFVLFGPPGSLSYLRSYGFRTFDNFWDESYDLEKDHDRRLAQIVGLIRHLETMPGEDFGNLMTAVAEIIDHNHQHLFSDRFEDILLSELHNNMRTSLWHQHQRQMSDPGGPLLSAMNSMLDRQIDLPFQLKMLMENLANNYYQYQPGEYQRFVQQYAWLDRFRT